jgi:uncharacterized protein involved in exopolysaccharide biosynthesis
MQTSQGSPSLDNSPLLNGLDYFSILKRERRIIYASLIFFITATIAVRILVPSQYESRIVTIPAPTESIARPTAMNSLANLGLFDLGGSANPKEVAIATLRARSFIVGFIHQRKLLPYLFSERWDTSAGHWNSSGPPTDEEAFEKLNNAMSIDSSATDNLVVVRVRWADSNFAASIANELLQTLNRRFQAKAVAESDRMVAYLTDAYQATQISEVRTNLANLIQDQIRQRILAKSRDEYSLTVIDPAAPTTKRVNPGLSILLPAAILLGLLFGIPAAFLAHTLKPRWRGPLARLFAPRT